MQDAPVFLEWLLVFVEMKTGINRRFKATLTSPRKEIRRSAIDWGGPTTA